jgi:hypothetical protein
MATYNNPAELSPSFNPINYGNGKSISFHNGIPFCSQSSLPCTISGSGNVNSDQTVNLITVNGTGYPSTYSLSSLPFGVHYIIFTAVYNNDIAYGTQLFNVISDGTNNKIYNVNPANIPSQGGISNGGNCSVDTVGYPGSVAFINVTTNHGNSLSISLKTLAGNAVTVNYSWRLYTLAFTYGGDPAATASSSSLKNTLSFYKGPNSTLFPTYVNGGSIICPANQDIVISSTSLNPLSSGVYWIVWTYPNESRQFYGGVEICQLSSSLKQTITSFVPTNVNGNSNHIICQLFPVYIQLHNADVVNSFNVTWFIYKLS